MSKVILLGTGTCQIEKDKMATSMLIQHKGKNILFDMGRGVCGRLLELGIKQDDLENIIISHFHPDHVTDLFSFVHAGMWSKIDKRTKDLNIYGPDGIDEFVEKFIDGLCKYKKHAEFNINVVSYQEKGLVIDDLEFETKALPPSVNHGIKFKINNKVIAFTGDSEFQEAEIEFLKGVDLAFIDSTGHLTTEEIIGLIVKSDVPEVVCVHQYFPVEIEKIEKEAKERGYEGKIIVGEDLMQFEL